MFSHDREDGRKLTVVSPRHPVQHVAKDEHEKSEHRVPR
jgi:hypothetical protein